MTFPSPPASVSKHQIDQAWYNLRAYMGSSFANWQGVLLVGLDGDDSTAQRNSLTNKYLTIQAALDDAQLGDTVWVGPGTYEENIAWPSVDRVTLRGFGNNETIISGTIVPTIDITPTAVLMVVTIKDIRVENTGAAPAIVVDGSSNSISSLVIENVTCVTGTQVLIESVVRADVKNLVLNTGIDLTLTGVDQAIFEQCRLRDMAVDYPIATPGLNQIVINSTTVENILVNNLARVVLMKDTQCSSITTNLVDLLDGMDTYVGTIWCFGKVIGNVDIVFNMTEQSSEIARFDYAEIGGLVQVAGVGGQFQTANFRNAILHDTAGMHVAGDWSIVDLRGALFEQLSLNMVGTGSFDRTNHYIIDLAGGIGPRTIDIVPPYPAGTTQYTVVSENDDSADHVSITLVSKVANSFEVTKALGTSNVIFNLIRPYD